jgi:hypothetical protein
VANGEASDVPREPYLAIDGGIGRILGVLDAGVWCLKMRIALSMQELGRSVVRKLMYLFGSPGLGVLCSASLAL